MMKLTPELARRIGAAKRAVAAAFPTAYAERPRANVWNVVAGGRVIATASGQVEAWEAAAIASAAA